MDEFRTTSVLVELLWEGDLSTSMRKHLDSVLEAWENQQMEYRIGNGETKTKTVPLFWITEKTQPGEFGEVREIWSAVCRTNQIGTVAATFNSIEEESREVCFQLYLYEEIH